ncbi:ostA-like family protein [Candidatus Endolissoclinum faulkneri L2]|uniref:OstA-like family protein n=1 Tax=Candidatus Endolissoclinum faulkneri L2 TaxID=1193729 RepID=K7YJ66_9PROT|nr:LptA/OstA family protein [Candidatus Endolissoclinum faulkneri]AFX99690.1 ostA-like family protein [Candidatus Endolissoclinum faulkneri L2]
MAFLYMAYISDILAVVLLFAFNVNWYTSNAHSLERENKNKVTVEAADIIEWNRDKKIYIARGNVKAMRDTFTISADTLTAVYRSKNSNKGEIYRLEALGHVVITSTENRAAGGHAIYDIDKQIITLTGNNLFFKNGFYTITARDSIKYLKSCRIAIASGAAAVWRNKQTIKADVLTAYFEHSPSSDNQIKELKAIGNVIIVTPQEILQSNEGHYDVFNEIAQMEGNVRITRGSNQISGERAQINLKTGLSYILPRLKSGGRVQGLFAKE